MNFSLWKKLENDAYLQTSDYFRASYRLDHFMISNFKRLTILGFSKNAIVVS